MKNKMIKDSSKFSELGLDSLEKVEILAEVEEKLNLTLENEISEKIMTIFDATNAFKNHSK